MKSKNSENIILKGIEVNNLKNIDACFPLNKISVVTGVSGSGKSSLIFDTLYSEAYRRYIESLSSFARQYMQDIPKPKIAVVQNLPPAIAVKQSRQKSNSRSTVGTMTEISDLLKDIFCFNYEVKCQNCGSIITKHQRNSVITDLIHKHNHKTLTILVSLDKYDKIKPKDLQNFLMEQGFTRLINQNFEVIKTENIPQKDLKSAYIVVDRVKIDLNKKTRIEEAINLALKLNKNKVQLIDEQNQFINYSLTLTCLDCNITYPPPASAMFSFNHPRGACTGCQGFGMMSVLDHEKIVPDQDKSLAESAVVAWNFGLKAKYNQWVQKCAKKQNIDIHKPIKKFNKKELQWLYEGDNKEFDGINGFFTWLDSKRYKAHYRIHAARFRKYVTCSSCNGFRYKQDSLNYYVNGLNIAQANQLPFSDLSDWIKQVIKTWENKDQSVYQSLEETLFRVDYLLRVGLKYLHLGRSARTLSGGESQRINMARCLGNRLTDTLFCLDEPTCGLHPKDSQNLFEVISDLRDQGNTVVMVEHEKQIINKADYLIQVGPLAGHLGGEITYSGKPLKQEYISKFNTLHKQDIFADGFLQLEDVEMNNLKKVTCKIPLGKVTGVCGVSGSGKSSLISGALYQSVAHFFKQEAEEKLDLNLCGKLKNEKLKNYYQILHLNQGSIGRSSRSNIATYIGIYDEIRKIFAAQTQAKKLKLNPGSFSFNTPGGRCENCKGLGYIQEDLSFLGEMTTVCTICNGKKFTDSLLTVRYKNHNIFDVLNLTVLQARDLFHEHPKIADTLSHVIDTGLGYINLGQSTSSFSGGEAQRIKLINILAALKDKNRQILILDEPSTGLSDYDIELLLKQIRLLSDRGHTIIIIEHHMGILSCSDWLVELGPDAGENGGKIIYQGSSHEILKSDESVSKEFISEYL